MSSTIVRHPTTMKKTAVSTIELLERLVPADLLDETGLRLYARLSASADDGEARRLAVQLLDRLCELGYMRRISRSVSGGEVVSRYRNLLTLDSIRVSVKPPAEVSAAQASPGPARGATEAVAAPPQPQQPAGGAFLTRAFLQAVAASSRRTDLASALGHLYDLMHETIGHDRVAVCMARSLTNSQVGNLLELDDICEAPDEESLAPSRLQETVEQSGETVHIPDLKSDTRHARWSAVSGRTGSLIVAPLKAEAYVYGTMSVWSSRSHAFDPNSVAVVEFIAEFAAGLMKRRLEVEELIFIDQTCQIHNRRYFDEQLLREIERSRRTGNPMALLIGDLDDFKLVNDTLGHAAGDSVLRQVGRILSDNARQVDIVARYGGEEFGVILPDVTREGALAVAERIRSTVSMHSFVTGSDTQPTWDLTISIGGALYPMDAGSQTELLDRADRISLYEAKHRGKNRVVFWQDVHQP
jgi:diguanylate cyclase (GGDEF)-like protein